MATVSFAIFLITYTGVALGRLPRLAIDRTGVALLGAMAMVVGGVLLPEEAADAVHLPTLLLLYGLMLVSAQLRLGGFYTWLAQRVTSWVDRPRCFLLVLMIVSGFLSSMLANDIICLAFTPVLAVSLRRKGMNPVPFLLGLAMATNLGSASTLIGNPQSMLIGQTQNLSFLDFFLWCAPPSILGLFTTYAILLLMYRGRLTVSPDEAGPVIEPDWPEFNRWQSMKGLLATVVVVVFMFMKYPREWSVLAVGGSLLLSRRMHTRTVLGIIDWHLITLFCGLFIVVRGFNASGIPVRLVSALAASGLDLSRSPVLAVVSMVLSNIVSNVPATVLLIPHVSAEGPVTWYVLSLATTYAGNLLTIGSMANLIVIEQARLNGVRIGFREYARTGVVVTAVNLILLLLWMKVRALGG